MKEAMLDILELTADLVTGTTAAIIFDELMPFSLTPGKRLVFKLGSVIFGTCVAHKASQYFREEVENVIDTGEALKKQIEYQKLLNSKGVSDDGASE